MALDKIWQPTPQFQLAKGRGNAQAQGAGRLLLMLGQFQGHGLHLFEDLHAMAIEQRTGFGQVQAAGGTGEQLRAEVAFEVLHLA
ncbi:hypothetical protein D3C79_844410 [compost metagenome]